MVCTYGKNLFDTNAIPRTFSITSYKSYSLRLKIRLARFKDFFFLIFFFLIIFFFLFFLLIFFFFNFFFFLFIFIFVRKSIEKVSRFYKPVAIYYLHLGYYVILYF